jgi:hypothetical protein
VSQAASSVIDFYDDPRGLTKLSLPAGLEGVQFEPLSEADRDRLAGGCFGLVSITKHAGVFREFPLNDAGNSWLSAQSFDANHEKLAMPARFMRRQFHYLDPVPAARRRSRSWPAMASEGRRDLRPAYQICTMK